MVARGVPPALHPPAQPHAPQLRGSPTICYHTRNHPCEDECMLDAVPLLVTKTAAPFVRPQFVQRPRFLERLDRGLHGKVLLVAAAAGWGKSSLVSGWL